MEFAKSFHLRDECVSYLEEALYYELGSFPKEWACDEWDDLLVRGSFSFPDLHQLKNCVFVKGAYQRYHFFVPTLLYLYAT